MWRSPQSAGVKNLNPTMEVSVPLHFRCPISLDLMKDPVTVSAGITYDRQSIETWLDNGNKTCPVTNQFIPGHDLIPNHTIRKMIQDWCVANRSHGVERIPTPRIPVMNVEVSEMVADIDLATRRGDHVMCMELVAKVAALAKESVRNRRCISSNGMGKVFSASFDAFARMPYHTKNLEVQDQILSALPPMFPLDDESCSYLCSPESLHSLVNLLKLAEFAGRFNAVLVLKELLLPAKGRANAVAETEQLIEALVPLIKYRISPRATKTSLAVAFYLVSSNERAALRFVDMGVVHLLLEILVDSEKSTSERALGVLDGICDCEAGREKIKGHALAVPVLVKKMFRVSDMATEFAVSMLWKLCKDQKGGEECVGEAFQSGAFQKLLLLLQVGCCGETKEKVTELLKLLNGYKGMLDCVDSVDFKGLKKPF